MKRVKALSFVRVAIIALLIANWGSLTSVANQTAPSSPKQTPGQSFTAHVEAAAKKARSFEDFVAAIHHVETTGRTGPIYGDGRRSLGPLQISLAAWKDARRFDKTIGGNYSDCKNLAYSTKVMRAYLQAHDPTAFKTGNWEACARLWNSGPSWSAKVRLTNQYWAKVRVKLAERQTT
jgi:hypothetical protein